MYAKYIDWQYKILNWWKNMQSSFEKLYQTPPSGLILGIAPCNKNCLEVALTRHVHRGIFPLNLGDAYCLFKFIWIFTCCIICFKPKFLHPHIVKYIRMRKVRGILRTCLFYHVSGNNAGQKHHFECWWSCDLIWIFLVYCNAIRIYCFNPNSNCSIENNYPSKLLFIINVVWL